MKKVLLLLFFAQTFLFAATSMYFRGEFNGWGTTAMTKRSLGTPSFLVTIQENTTGLRNFKFDLNGDWGNNWGVNETISFGSVRTIYLNHPNDVKYNSVSGKYYTFIMKDCGETENSETVVFETTNSPVTISSVNSTLDGSGATVEVEISAAKSPEERVYIRYTKDGWTTSTFVEITNFGAGTIGTGLIPIEDLTGDDENNTYYVLTTATNSINHSNADMLTIDYSNNSGTNFTLPVELSALTAKSVEAGILLNWKTATEKNNYGFEIERFTPSGVEGQLSAWKTIGFVEGNGNSNAEISYSYIDKNPSVGKNIYRLKQIDFDGKYEYSKEIEVLNNISSEFSLKQNYPNPFNPTTKINFSIGQKSQVTLKIYNMLGEEITTLVNRNLEAGNHFVSFNASNLPSGTYICLMKAGNYTESRKLLLIK